MPTSLTLAASASRTETGAGSAVDLAGDHEQYLVTLDITAVTGTDPTLDLDILGTDGAGNTVFTWSFPQQTGVAAPTLLIPVSAVSGVRQLKGDWTLGGTSPDFTFSLTAVESNGRPGI